MQFSSRGVVLGLVCVLAVSIPVLRASDASGAPPAGLTTSPLVLKVVHAPNQTIPAVPSTAVFSTSTYVTMESDGPFCVQGFYPDHSQTAAGTLGDVWISLTRMDSIGMSHDHVEIHDGATGGSSGLDLVIMYGSPICAADSLEFELRSFPPAAGPGIETNFSARAIVLAAADVTVTMRAGEQYPSE